MSNLNSQGQLYFSIIKSFYCHYFTKLCLFLMDLKFKILLNKSKFFKLCFSKVLNQNYLQTWQRSKIVTLLPEQVNILAALFSNLIITLNMGNQIKKFNLRNNQHSFQCSSSVQFDYIVWINLIHVQPILEAQYSQWVWYQSVDSHQISPKDSLLLRILDLVSQPVCPFCQTKYFHRFVPSHIYVTNSPCETSAEQNSTCILTQ